MAAAFAKKSIAWAPHWNSSLKLNLHGIDFDCWQPGRARCVSDQELLASAPLPAGSDAMTPAIAPCATQPAVGGHAARLMGRRVKITVEKLDPRAENDYLLVSFEEEPEVDITAVQKEIQTLESELKEVQKEIDKYMKELTA